MIHEPDLTLTKRIVTVQVRRGTVTTEYTVGASSEDLDVIIRRLDRVIRDIKRGVK